MAKSIEQFTALAQVVAGIEKQAKKDLLRGAYPDYGKSLVAQRKSNPLVSGMLRGTETGALGGILAALLARLASKDPKIVGAAGAGGFLLGGVPGYISGKREAESEHTRRLALRRLGINNPAEYMLAAHNPELTKKLTSEEVYL